MAGLHDGVVGSAMTATRARVSAEEEMCPEGACEPGYDPDSLRGAIHALYVECGLLERSVAQLLERAQYVCTPIPEAAIGVGRADGPAVCGAVADIVAVCGAVADIASACRQLALNRLAIDSLIASLAV